MGQQLKYVWGNLPNLANQSALFAQRIYLELGTFGSKKTDNLRYLKLFKHVVFTWMADIAKLVNAATTTTKKGEAAEMRKTK